ncbi:hypothetical protein SANBI_000513 [Sanguibacter sp. 4.1]|uniref:DUF2975 domain-containing protein n=1 Tax=Sanguibacter biliveldensis TaxID=3030830 RepID=A0AAF0Z979_9MICO|nr:hypothetical protein [Sanguibacter sp. 4.1]WPF82881.1 hypothetical protein SANBI_000513 [Sanguibacter sp. 4.1]
MSAGVVPEVGRDAEARPRRRAQRVRRLVTASVVVVATLTVVGRLSTAWMTITGRYVYTLGGADPRLSLSDLPQMGSATLREGTTGTLEDVDLGMRLLGATPSLVHAATVGLAAWLLLRVLKGISAGAPFTPAVLRWWSRLTVVLLVGGVTQAVLDTGAVVYLSSRIGLLFGSGRVSTEQREAFLGGDYMMTNIATPDWPVPILVAGLVALALTTAFRAGARLERDVDGVV